jgi:hypothetical protein
MNDSMESQFKNRHRIVVSDHIQEPRTDKSQSPIAYLKAVDVGELLFDSLS